mmetsp:Transcript_11924/g.33737  ORF Transcript_11924/g.33737 Transcript_11924/m.33737 type:complete len:329 (+) Transcript_11924:1067-2053(+)
MGHGPLGLVPPQCRALALPIFVPGPHLEHLGGLREEALLPFRVLPLFGLGRLQPFSQFGEIEALVVPEVKVEDVLQVGVPAIRGDLDGGDLLGDVALELAHRAGHGVEQADDLLGGLRRRVGARLARVVVHLRHDAADVAHQVLPVHPGLAVVLGAGLAGLGAVEEDPALLGGLREAPRVLVLRVHVLAHLLAYYGHFLRNPILVCTRSLRLALPVVALQCVTHEVAAGSHVHLCHVRVGQLLTFPLVHVGADHAAIRLRERDLHSAQQAAESLLLVRCCLAGLCPVLCRGDHTVLPDAAPAGVDLVQHQAEAERVGVALARLEILCR